MRFFCFVLLAFLSSCSHVNKSQDLKNFLDFNSLNFQGKVYSIGSIYSEADFSPNKFIKNNLGSCLTFFNPDDAISYIFYDKKLTSILVKYDNKSIYTTKNINNGMKAENIMKNYKGFDVEKVNSEGSGDSQQDFKYTVFDKNFKNNILIFDVVNDEIQGIHLEQKGFSMSDCDE